MLLLNFATLLSLAHGSTVEFACAHLLAQLTGTIESAEPQLATVSDERFAHFVMARRSFVFADNPDRLVRSPRAGQDFPRAVIRRVRPGFFRTFRPCAPQTLAAAEREVTQVTYDAYLERLGQRRQHVLCVHRRDGTLVGLLQAWTEHVGGFRGEGIIERERRFVRTATGWRLFRDARRRLVAY